MLRYGKFYNKLMAMKKFVFIALILSFIIPRNAVAIEYVNMMVGETKTLYLPSSVTTKRLNTVNFISYGVDCVDIVTHSMSSVKIKAIKKTPTAGVIVRCSYTYFILRDGKYVYGGTGAYDYNVKVTGIDPTTVSLPEELRLQPGESRILTATLYPSNATTDLTWESSVYSIVNVWQTGEVLAQRNGTSVITVTTSNGKKAQCKVIVGPEDILPTSVSISTSVSTIYVGETKNLAATVLPNNATDKSVAWYSSNPSVVRVDYGSGQITGVKAGYATITVATNNGLSSSLVIECKENLSTIILDDKTGYIGVLPEKANVGYERVFLRGWNTMCVPFAVTEAMLQETGAGLRMAIVKDIEVEGDRKKVVLESINSVKGGQPCLVYASSDVTWTVSLSSVELASNPQTSSLLKGSYTLETIGAGHAKLASDGGSFSYTRMDSAKIYPFRCYIEEY